MIVIIVNDVSVYAAARHTAIYIHANAVDVCGIELCDYDAYYIMMLSDCVC